MARISPATFTKIATLVVLCYVLLVLTGGAVRLTGSGLGCPDWPTCYAHHFTAARSYHQRIEDTNRLVTIFVSIISVLVVLGALCRSPRRKDLVQLSLGIFAGLVAQIILGGLVVLFKLNPYLVALHFLLTLVVLLVAIGLRHRSVSAPARPSLIVPASLRWLVRVLVGALSVVIVLGTLVAGAGPHSGGTNAKRIPIAFRDIAELHSTAALFLIGLTLGMLFAVHQAKVPALIERRARLVLEILTLQGALGFSQYALHDNAVIVEFHIAGATAVWLAAIALYLSLHEQLSEQLPAESRYGQPDSEGQNDLDQSSVPA